LLALKLKGSVQMRVKNYELALATFQNYRKLGGEDIGVHFNIMRLLKWLERNDERADYAKELLLSGMDHASVYTHLGDALCQTGNFSKGVEMLIQAISLDDHQSEAHYLLAKIMSLTHHKTEALDHLESAINDNPVYVLKAKYDDDFNNLRFFRKFYTLTEEVHA
jgi:tetratricopeptide (TPR) repeat protein